MGIAQVKTLLMSKASQEGRKADQAPVRQLATSWKVPCSSWTVSTYACAPMARRAGRGGAGQGGTGRTGTGRGAAGRGRTGRIREGRRGTGQVRSPCRKTVSAPVAAVAC